MRNKHVFVLLAMTGLSLRIALAPFTAHPYDMGTWYNLSGLILKNHNLGIVTSESPALSTIVSMYYTLIPLSYLYFYLAPLFHVTAPALGSFATSVQSAAEWTIPSSTPQTMFVTNWLYNSLIKIPFILADLGTGLTIYNLASKFYGERVALTSFALWFLNPMLIWVSGVWGMFDSLPAFFVMLSIYFLVRQDNIFSAVSMAVAIGFKLYPFFLLLPIVAYMYMSKRSLKKILVPILAFLMTTLVMFAPFFQYLGSAVNSYLNSPVASTSSNLSEMYGLTFWSVASLSKISGSIANDLSLFLFVSLGIITSIISIQKLRKNNSLETLLFCQVLIESTIFLSYLRVNEQWFVWLLPPFVLLTAPKWLKKRYVLSISVLAMIYSWVSSLFAAFFIPIVLYNEEFVESLYSFTALLIPYRLDLMAALGISFSVLLIFLIVRLNSNIRIHFTLAKSPVRQVAPSSGESYTSVTAVDELLKII